MVCHGIPSEEEILEEGDIINVDCTTILDGYYADASRMFIIGKTTPQKEKLVRVAKECLEVGMEAARPFGFVGDIGHAVEKHAKKNGFSVVRDLCGHGVGVEFHEEPDVEHFSKKGTGMLLVPGMVFTIEPMINMGTWEVFIDEEDGWTVVTEDELPSAQWEHTFVMTEQMLRDGYISMDMAQNILVIKTVSGMAMAVAAAVDAMKWKEVVGCIAGDDTIMCAIRSVQDTEHVMDKIRKIVSKGI